MGHRGRDLGSPRARHADHRHVRVRRRDAFEQVLERTGGQRVHEIRGDLHARLEHEPPGDHPRMRQCQRCGIEDDRVVEQQVEVDRPWAPPFAAFTIERVLHRREHAEHIVRSQIGLEQARAVEKNTLPGRAADRPGVAVAAHAHERDARHEPQQFHRAVEILTPFSDVGTATDKASCHSVSHQSGCSQRASTQRHRTPILSAGPPPESITPNEPPAKDWKTSQKTSQKKLPNHRSKTGGTSRPRPKSPTVAPSSRRPRNFRDDGFFCVRLCLLRCLTAAVA